jgi:hypothetical protein
MHQNLNECLFIHPLIFLLYFIAAFLAVLFFISNNNIYNIYNNSNVDVGNSDIWFILITWGLI